MTEMRLYLMQRVSAMIMAPLVLLHLGMMIYAIQGGLDAAEILSRTQGSLFWGAVYGLFVLAVAIHASIGLRSIFREWLQLRGKALSLLGSAIFLLLLITGMRAVFALVIS